MKQTKGLILACAAALALVSPQPALAAHLTGSSNWSVTYNSEGKMEDTYSAQEYVDQVKNLQPGDDITFYVANKHENATEGDWYVSNDVITSLEDSRDSAEGSAYEYLLTYEGANESRTLYDSTMVGGDETDGLNEATDALDEYIFLERMKKGQSGKLTLKVTLDGETEGNAYFDTMAQLKVRYAVEAQPEDKKEEEKNPLKDTTPTNTVVNRTIVRTGEEAEMFPFYIAMVVSGFLFLILAIDSVRQRRKAREEAVR